MLRATPAVPTKTFFQAANQCIFGRKNPFAFPLKDCALFHVDFFSRQVETTVFRSNSDDAFLKFFFKIRLRRETNLMQPCLANQHQVIMHS